MSFEYVSEKVMSAALSLVQMDASLPERLEVAFLDGLLRLENEQDWGTDQIRSTWDGIRDVVDLGGEGPLRARIDELDPADQADLAAAILALHRQVETHAGSNQ